MAADLPAELREAAGRAAHDARRIEIASQELKPGGKGHAPEACPWVTHSTNVVAERCGAWAPGVLCKKCDPLLRAWPDLTDTQRETFRASQDPGLSLVAPVLAGCATALRDHAAGGPYPPSPLLARLAALGVRP